MKRYKILDDESFIEFDDENKIVTGRLSKKVHAIIEIIIAGFIAILACGWLYAFWRVGDVVMEFVLVSVIAVCLGVILGLLICLFVEKWKQGKTEKTGRKNAGE